MVRGLYMFRPSSDCDVLVSHSPSVVCSVSSMELWHNQLGHPSAKCSRMLQKILSFSFLANKDPIQDPCLVCPLAKQQRLSFSFNNDFASNLFYLIHCDVQGPYRIPTHAGYRYFLTLVDDCTYYTWIFLLKHKSNTNRLFHNFSPLCKLSSTNG